MKVITWIIAFALSLIVMTSVSAQTSRTTPPSDTVVLKQSSCMRFIDDWADKCGNFGPIKLTHAQQKRKMDRCSDLSLAFAKLLPDNDPTLAEQTVNELSRCLTGANTDSDLGVTPVGSGHPVSTSSSVVGQ